MLSIKFSTIVLTLTTQVFSTGLLITPAFFTVVFLGSIAIIGMIGVEGEQVLDTSYPILVEELQTNWTHTSSEFFSSKSFFGYTVSLAQGERQLEDHPAGWIFIGAPKSNLTVFNYSTVDTEAGVVWRCSLGRKSSNNAFNQNDFCEMMNMDPKPEGKLQQRPASPSFESHIGAWIGASLEIKHNRFVSCGFRWKRGKYYSYYNGICYWFNATMSPGRSSYCKSNNLSSLVDKNSYDHRLMPFVKPKGDSIMDESMFQNYVGDRKVLNPEWQVSQAGISVHLFLDKVSGQDQPNKGPNLLIGAPGARQWSGAVALYTNSKEPNASMTRPNRNKNDPTFSEFLILHRGIIPKKDSPDSHYFWNEYFGYSVSAGRYFKTEQTLYAAGAPGGNRRRGTVVIFDSPPFKAPTETYKRQINTIQEIEAPSLSKGLQFGSYFGSVIHSVDLDGDGLDELVVGAPLYTFIDSFSTEESRPSRGSAAGSASSTTPSGDHGCVFVYFKDGTSTELQLFDDLVGAKSPRARFGSAISSIVFNLKDGTRQVYLVIGAPYEQSDQEGSGSNSGAIYLYKSLSAKGQKFGRHSSQRITASQISSFVNGFGSSISISEDADGNQTPDLAVGAFKSGHAIVLRTRPQIVLKSWIKFEADSKDKPISEIKEVQRGSKSFYLLPCFKIDENLGLVNNKLDIWVNIKFHDRAVQFEKISRQINEKTFLMKRVDAYAKETCGSRIKILAVNPEGFGYENSSSTAKDLEAIPPSLIFYQEIWYNGTMNRNLTVSKLYAGTRGPTNEPTGRGGIYDFFAFNQNLPNPESSKAEGKINVSLSECSGNVCQPDLQMKWTFTYPNAEGNGQGMSVYILGQQMKEVVMQLIISNANETALVQSIEFTWNITDVKISTFGNWWLSNKCNKSVDGSKISYLCDVWRYIRKGRNVTVEIRWNMDEVFVREDKDFQFVVNARVNFKDEHIPAQRSTGQLRLEVPNTMATIFGSKSKREEILRGHNSCHVKPVSVTTTTERGSVTRNHSVQGDGVLHSCMHAFEQRFKLDVQGASVNELTAEFKIPLVPNEFGEEFQNKPLFFVTPPHFSPIGKENKAFADIKCTHLPSSFHLVQVIGDEMKTSSTTKHRQRREVSYSDGSIVPFLAQDSFPHEVNKSKLESPENALKFTCGSSEAYRCIEITCKITNVKAKRQIHISFEMYPVKDRITELLKTTGKTKLFVEATGTVSIFISSNSKGIKSDMDVAQTILTENSERPQAWHYVLPAGGGILLLAFIVVGLYFCGFFKREKRQELNQMKAAHYRKSMAAAARGSMMVQATSGGISGIPGSSCGDSRENLTEAEHHNEDIQIIDPIAKSTETIEEEVEAEVGNTK